MRHRHLEITPGTPVDELDPAAVDDLLDRGALADWAPLAAAIRRDPSGELADRVLALVEAHPMFGTSPLWRAWIEGLRASSPATPPLGPQLRRLREQAGLTQKQVADRLGMTQPEVSKLERRADTRVSTARDYVRALGGELVLTARIGGGLAQPLGEVGGPVDVARDLEPVARDEPHR